MLYPAPRATRRQNQKQYQLVTWWRRRESNADLTTSVDLGSSRSSVDSAAKQDVCEGELEDANAVDLGRDRSACSNVASEIERALVSLREGRLHAAQEVLEGLLRTLHHEDASRR